MAALERLRRLEQVVHDLVRRRIQADVVGGATWEDVSRVVGMPAAEIKRTYPIWDTDERNRGWG
jgi:hypothetical protein